MKSIEFFNFLFLVHLSPSYVGFKYYYQQKSLPSLPSPNPSSYNVPCIDTTTTKWWNFTTRSRLYYRQWWRPTIHITTKNLIRYIKRYFIFHKNFPPPHWNHRTTYRSTPRIRVSSRSFVCVTSTRMESLSTGKSRTLTGRLLPRDQGCVFGNKQVRNKDPLDLNHRSGSLRSTRLDDQTPGPCPSWQRDGILLPTFGDNHTEDTVNSFITENWGLRRE